MIAAELLLPVLVFQIGRPLGPMDVICHVHAMPLPLH
jgi:hypothetical protein